MSELSKEACAILEDMELVRGDCELRNCPEVHELFKKGYLEAELMPWRECFYAQVNITGKGIAVANRLN